MYQDRLLPAAAPCAYFTPPPPPPWRTQALAADAPVQRLRVPKRCMAVLESLHGAVWLTMAGTLDDHFLAPGQRRYCPGPALLFVGTQGQEAATVRWVLLHPGQHGPA
ncbi:DUF2917 domain-containing protein [Comamonas sp. GB3 AK4-5]|uniref:DUF2917 domain-containing protein n=1 Tax=Comamonas sp. GB3 AK4-5 TaxID=3231487 RepID=UPI00351E6CC1